MRTLENVYEELTKSIDRISDFEIARLINHPEGSLDTLKWITLTVH